MTQCEMKEKYIEKAINEHWKICVYGLGFLGRRLYNTLPAMFRLEPEYYSDGNPDKVDGEILPIKNKIYKSELLSVKEDFLVFVLVDSPIDKLIENELAENEKVHVITLRDAIQMKTVIKAFYGEALYRKYEHLQDYH